MTVAADTPAGTGLYHLAERARERGDRAAHGRLLKAVLDADPDHAAAWFNMGVRLNAEGRHVAACAAFHRVLEVCPDEPRTLVNLGWNEYLRTRYRAAAGLLKRAVTTDPSLVLGWVNLSLALSELGDHDAAIMAARSAVTVGPGDPQANMVLAFALMRVGAWKEAFAGYEWRFAYKLPEFLDYPTPRWDGSHVEHLFVPAEQGFGDTIQFARFLPLAAERVGRLTVAVQAELVSLLAPALAPIEVVPMPHPTTVGDAFCPLLSLPWSLGLERPDTVPPLAAHERSDTALSLTRRLPRIGVVWAGSSEHDNDRWRSMPVEALCDLTRGQMYSLQVGPKAADAEALRPLIRPLPAPRDFAETAAAMCAMDEIVTVDTSAAHLAGSLGVKTWLLLPAHGADPRWGVGDVTPWYPEMRIVRQTSPGDWRDAVRVVSQGGNMSVAFAKAMNEGHARWRRSVWPPGFHIHRGGVFGAMFVLRETGTPVYSSMTPLMLSHYDLAAEDWEPYHG